MPGRHVSKALCILSEWSGICLHRLCTCCVGKCNFCCPSGCITCKSMGQLFLCNLCLVFRKESLSSVCNWRLGLGEYTYQNADQKGFSEKKKQPLQEGHTKSCYKICSFLPFKDLEVEKHLEKKNNKVIHNRVVILGLGEPKQIIRWCIGWHKCIPLPPSISLCGILTQE